MQKGCFHLLIRAAIGHRIPSHQHLDYGSSNPRHWAWIPQSPHNRHISFISLDFELSKGQLPLGYSQPVSEPFHTHSQGNDPPTDNRVLSTLFPEACVLEGFIHKQWNKHFLMALKGKKKPKQTSKPYLKGPIITTYQCRIHLSASPVPLL